MDPRTYKNFLSGYIGLSEYHIISAFRWPADYQHPLRTSRVISLTSTDRAPSCSL